MKKSYRQPASELAGVRTFVDEKSDKGIPDPSPSSSYLPSDSPKSDKYRAKPLPSTHSKSRDKHIPQPAYNAPGSSQDGNSIKVRTPSTPGAQYGHPYIDQGTSLHKRRTMQAAVEPYQKIQAIVDQLYKKGLIEDPIQVRYYGPIGSGDVQIQLFTSSGRVGFFFTDRIAYGWDPISGLPLNPECKKAFRKIKKRSPDLELWSLEASNLKDKRLWNKGIGKLAYEQILKDAGSYGAAVVPHWCRKGGSTSGMAQRVWDSLKRRYESEGPIVIPKTLRLASPQRVVSFGAQYGHPYIDQGTSLHKRRTMQASIKRVAARKIAEMTGEASIALMRWLSKATQRVGVARHVYVVGGAVRNFLIDKPIKDIDMVVDSLSISGGRGADWVAQQIAKAIPTPTKIVTDALMVSKVYIEGPWLLDGHQMQGEVIEIVNAREEIYEQDDEGNYLGHKPIRVDPTTLETDATRREFTFNTLMWRLLDLAEGPDKAEIIDLTGCGVRDLNNLEMRCPQSPDKTFKQDPTRILRTIKFAFRYGFKLPPDVKAAARRQAKGLKRIPDKAWSVLRTIVLENPQYKKALLIMDELGVLQVLREMVQEDLPFATTLSNYTKSKDFSFLFDLMDLGIPIHTSVSFLNRSQQARFREIVTPMDRDEALDFLSKVESPGNAYKDKRFFPTLMRELGIRNGKALAQRLKPISINLILSNPRLAYQPNKLKRAITQTVMREF